MQKTPTHWPSLLIFIIVVIGAGLFLLSAIGFGITSLYTLITDGDDPAGMMIASISAGFEGILLAVIAWFVFQRIKGLDKADEPFHFPFSYWHIFLMLGLAATALPLGALVSYLEIKFLSWLILPILTLLLIIPPIWVLLGVGTSKLGFGPRWRTLGILGLGMTLGPLIMLGLEFTLVFIVVLVGTFFVIQQPGLVNEILQLASALQNETNPDAILEMLAPYVFDPTIMGIAVGYIALAVPMIEELFKPLGVWLFARKIESPAQGFALGLLSGAAYALVESLGASGQGNAMWAIVVAVRAGTSLLHIFTTGLMGWAIVAAFQQKRYWRLLGTYIVVVLIHGIWNASALGAGFAATSDMLMDTRWSISILPAALCGLMILAIGMVVLLIAMNRRARKLSAIEVPAELAESGRSIEENTEGVK